MASVASLRDLTDALVESSIEAGEGKLDTVIADLEAFYRFVAGQDLLRKVLSTSAFKVEDRMAIVRDIGEKSGFDLLTTNFLALSIEVGKIGGLLNSEHTILRKLWKFSARLRAEITLASDPTPEELARIKAVLSRSTGREVELVVEVDSEIIGGVIAKVGDKIYDNSLKKQLEKIKGVLSA